MRTESNLIPIESDVNKYLNAPGLILDNHISDAFKTLGISSLLKRAKIKKRSGHQVNRIVFDLIQIPFLMLTNVFFFVRTQYEKANSAKNRYYRFLENANYNWRSFQLGLSKRVSKDIYPEDGDEQFFVLDDTTTEITGKLVELASYVYDHSIGKCVLGFQKLILGTFNGHHFIPIGQRVCVSKRKPDARSKATQYRKIPKSERIAQDSIGAIERAQINQSKLDKAICLLKAAQKKGFKVSTVLFDSWFCFNSFIIKLVVQLKLHVICQLKNMPKTNKYLYKDKPYTLKGLFTIAKSKMRTVKKYGFKQAVLIVSIPNSSVQLKIVFVQNDGQDKWHAFGATEITRSAKSILEAYSRRWSIEVFFKNCKQHLNFGKEQVSNFDSMIASDALVFMRYTLLTYLAALNKAQFYETFDTLREQRMTTCFGIRLLNYFLNQLKFVLENLRYLIENNLTSEALELINHLTDYSANSLQFEPQLK